MSRLENEPSGMLLGQANTPSGVLAVVLMGGEEHLIPAISDTAMSQVEAWVTDLTNTQGDQHG